MPHILIASRRVAPYLISGVTGAHVLARMHRLSRQPAADIPLHFFLLKNTDVVLALGGVPVVIWQLAKHKPRQLAPSSTIAPSTNGAAVSTSNTSLVAGIVHELRQIFTALLLGLGIIKRKADNGETQKIPPLVRRLNGLVRRGIGFVNMLEPAESATGREREHGA